VNIQQYRVLTRLLGPALWLWDRWRAYRQTIYRPYRSERWAHRLPTPLSNRTIWLHAVSVGETQACSPLLKALLNSFPEHTILLTHMTPTGRETGSSLFGKEIAQHKVQQCYLPYDLAGLPEKFLCHFQPKLGMILETEIWPNLIHACKIKGVPLGLANARLSDKSLTKMLRFPLLAQESFNGFTWVAAQSEHDALRLKKFRNTAITVSGNLKFDVPINDAMLLKGGQFKALQQNRLTISLASTREGEELMLLEILLEWAKSQQIPPLFMLIPRHPKRAAELRELLKLLGCDFAQRSLGQLPTAQTQVYLGDTLGEMWFYLGASHITIMGGGWLPLGGQNLIEPCMAGSATIVGPHMFNFLHATELALLEKSIIQCSLAHLPMHLDTLMVQSKRDTLTSNGKQFARKQIGSTAKHVAIAKRYLE
jgi:3-deoxy-D-manno-octulosonic-acid transferase